MAAPNSSTPVGGDSARAEYAEPEGDRSRSNAAAVARVSLLLALAGLLGSRAVLLCHEFIGHAGAALAVGGELVDHRLFLFGGGWVFTRVPDLSPAGKMFVSLGGVGIELAIAAALIVFAGRPRLSTAVRAAAASIAGLCIVHTGVYIGLGTHYGYGDGLLLHRALGEARTYIVVVASALAVAGAWWTGARLVQLLSPSLPQRSRFATIGALALAVGLAACANGTLLLTERALTSDPTYADIMRQEAERKARRAVAREVARRRALGEDMSERERASRTQRLAAREAPVPIRFPLYVAIALAALLSSLRRRDSQDVAPIRNSGLVRLAVLVAFFVACVGALHSPWWR